MYIEELQQQWKSLKVMGQPSQNLFWKLLQQLTNRLPFERPFGYLALMVIAVAEYPRFADRSARQRGGKQVCQMPSAPQPILIDRFESQWIQRYLRNGLSLLVFRQHAHLTRHLEPPP